MDKMRFETPDMTEQNIDRIAALFPGCVTEMRGGVDGKVKRGINFEMLKQMLSPDVVDGDECYEFTWVGKKASIVEANKPIRKTLRPCPEESKNWDTTENLYIEGDNLEVLKLLQEAYLGKVKMIYIDPPYNTGNDFIYADDFMRSQEEENEQMGMYDENENRLFKNTDTNGRFHSDWCSMMYSRLMLARNLLTDDGVIFISIDDNEVATMKYLCDDILGASNFVAQLVWEKKKKGSFLSNSITNVKEYIFVYCKQVSSFNGLIGEINSDTETYPCVNASNKRELRVIPSGIESKYKEKNFFMPKGSEISDTTMSIILHSDLVIEEGVLAQELILEGNWRYSQEAMSQYAERKELYITRDLYLRRIVKDTRYKTLKDLLPRTGDDLNVGHKDSIDLTNLNSSGWGSNEDADEELRLLLGVQKLLDYPKPVRLIEKLFASYRNTDECICMDFFSGSATTAHAVMQLNAEERQSLERSIENLDKSDPDYHSKFQALSSQLSQTGKRKFIMVQLPEPCDEQSEAYKAGYKNICEIGKERIRRAGAQILERSLESLERDGMIEKIDKSKLPVLSSKNSPVENLEKEGVIEKLSTSQLSAPSSKNSPAESFEKEGLIEKVSKSKISALSSKNSLGKEGVIEKYAGELSEIRSLEEVYGSGGARVSSHQAAAAGGDLRTGRPNASGGSFHSVEYSGGTVAGNAGVYPVFESGKGITGGVGNTVIALRSLALLNELGYRVCLERFRGDQQNACGTDQTSELQTLNSKLQALNSKLSLDTGFRVLKLDDSNMKDVYYAADEYDQQNLANMISNIKDDRTDLDLLFGCLLDWGVPLSMPYTSEQIEGCTVHTYNDGDLIACFDANIPESVVKEIASRKPLRAVFRDSSFANSPAKINVFEIFKLYMPEDADDISKRVRVI